MIDTWLVSAVAMARRWSLQDNLVSRLGLSHNRLELVSFEQRRVPASNCARQVAARHSASNNSRP